MKITQPKFLMAPMSAALLFATIFYLPSCQKEVSSDPLPEAHNLVLKFKPVVDFDSAQLKFGETYTNIHGESYTVRTFKFYVHSIELINTDSAKTFPISDEYYLINFEDSASAELKLSVLPYTYNRIAFTIGVDSARNVSGAQTGALDPANGMFWTWSTGYIMARLEGNSPSANTQQHSFQYHIGGFHSNDNTVKKANLLFPFGQKVVMTTNSTAEINITADVNDWFHTPNEIKLSETALIMNAGTEAVAIAENYSKMFTVTSIKNQ